MLRNCLLVFSLLFLFGCQQGVGKQGIKNEGIPKDETTQNDTNNFYRRYSGKLAGQDVVVQLHLRNGTLEGSYQYTHQGKTIALNSVGESTIPGEFFLTEYDQNHQPNYYNNNATWELKFVGTSIVGIWKSSDSQQHFPIRLNEDYPAGSIALHAKYLEDSFTNSAPKISIPLGLASCSYLLPIASSNNFLREVLAKQIVPEKKLEEAILPAIHQSIHEFFIDFIDTDSNQEREEDSNAASILTYTLDQNQNVVYNDENWLVTENFVATYTGGAHGNYGSDFANIDLLQQKVWTISDIIIDTMVLRPMLNDAARAYFELKPKDEIASRLLVHQVPPTSNFFLSNQGLTFVYNPYEITSYADGQIQLFVPYQKLLPLLTPAFKTRMHLVDTRGLAIVGGSSNRIYYE